MIQQSKLKTRVFIKIINPLHSLVETKVKREIFYHGNIDKIVNLVILIIT